MNANTKAERENLLRRLKDQSLREHAASTQLVGGANYKLNFFNALEMYNEHVVELELERISNPAARTGITAHAAKGRRYVVNLFKTWLETQNLSNITCEKLDAAIISKFIGWCVATPYAVGKSKIRRMRSAATINSYRRRLGVCLRWLNVQRPRLFPDFVIIQPALKVKSASVRPALALTPPELKSFLTQSLKPLPPSIIKRIKRGRKETFRQGQSRYTATPVDRLFLLLACTGMRLGEGLALKWSDLDLKSGRIVINAQKTAAWRLIPLINAPECEVAPAFLKTLKSWRKERPDSEYVLPHEGIQKPANPKYAWARVRKQSGIDITPQKLRQNFVSYCASMGVPPAIAAMWCGHSAQVAERHYRLQLMDRKKANSIQGAMGL